MSKVFYTIVSSVICSIPFFLSGVNENIVLLSLHILMVMICSYSIFSYTDRPYSLHKIVNLFFLFFLSISPYLQFKYNVQLWGGISFSEEDYIFTSTIILFIMVMYNSLYFAFYRIKNISIANFFYRKLKVDFVPAKINIKEFLVLLSLCFIALGFVLYLNNFNIYLLFFRGGDLADFNLIDESTNISQPISLLIDKFFTPLPCVIFLLAYKLRTSKIMLLFFALMMLLVAFPTAMPRFSAASIYIPVALTLFNIFEKKNMFVICFVFGLLVLFPFLDNFRYVTDNTTIHIGFDFSMFIEEHFDSYSSCLRIITNDLCTNGRQLLGSIFFFIPRSFWPSKPIGSGAVISEKLGLSFDNISCCYFAEGYINAGFLGILVFTIFLVVFTVSFDNLYWNIIKPKNVNSPAIEILYMFLLGLVFFILRGDLMSSFAFTVGFICTIFFINYILKLMRKIK